MDALLEHFREQLKTADSRVDSKALDVGQNDLFLFDLPNQLLEERVAQLVVVLSTLS